MAAPLDGTRPKCRHLHCAWALRSPPWGDCATRISWNSRVTVKIRFDPRTGRVLPISPRGREFGRDAPESGELSLLSSLDPAAAARPSSPAALHACYTQGGSERKGDRERRGARSRDSRVLADLTSDSLQIRSTFADSFCLSSRPSIDRSRP